MSTTKTFDIRRADPADPVNLLLGDYAFSSTPKVRSKEEEEGLQQRSEDITFHSCIDDVAVAKVGVIPMTQNVRGTVMAMGGIGGVCSMPVARRGGHIRALMQAAIEQMHESGQAVSSLYPFKTSYYEKFGYAGWQVPLWAHINPAALAPYMNVPKHGTVKQRLSGEAKDDLYGFLQHAQLQNHGMSLQQRVRFDNGFDRHPAWFMSVHEGDEITGGICYKLDLEKEVMQAFAVFWSTANAMAHILDFMARHVDQVKKISMPIRDGQHPQMWTTDDWSITILSNDEQSWGPPMARVVDVAGLNGVAAGNGRVSLRVRDDQAPWNCGVWTFSSEAGQLVVQDGGDADDEITINALSALVFSGIEPDLLPVRGWGAVSPAAADGLRSLFPPVVPYLHELF